MVEGVQGAVLDGSLLVALPVVLLAGVLSFFTPCSLPLVPGYLSYVAGLAGSQERDVAVARAGGRSKVVLGAGLFVAGFAVVFTLYGAAFGTVGSWLVLNQDVVWRVAGALTIVLGLLFAGAAGRLPVLSRTWRPSVTPRTGLLGAPVLGAVFGVGWTPCVGPALAAVLTLATTTATAGRGAVLALTYAVGIGIPFLVAALCLDRSMVAFARVRSWSRWFARLGGLALVGVGLLQVTGVWSSWVASVQVLVAGWSAPL